MYTKAQVEKIEEKLTPIDVEGGFRDMLDEVYGEVSICGYKYRASYALETIDPVAFRCGISDHSGTEEDWVEVGSEYYSKSEIEELLESDDE